MAVDTYLKNKSTAGYQMVRQDDVELLVSPVLARNVKSIHVGLKRFLFLKFWSIQLEPLSDHVHAPN